MEGVGWHHVNIKDGKRCSAREAYLWPALSRPNVTLSANSQATRLLFEGRRCLGVESIVRTAVSKQPGRNPKPLFAPGPSSLPKLLLLSGIGNPAHLSRA